MANYVKAIEFDSQLHQKQAVLHVMRTIELEFQKKQATLDFKTPLVQTIYDKLSHSNSSVVQCCCDILLIGTEKGRIHFTGFLNGLLNIMPTTSHPGILLKCLGDLLCCELKGIIQANRDAYQCPYSIRGKKPHPFISVTTSCPQLWPRLLALTKQMLHHPALECQSHIVDMLKPFIKYCLMPPGEAGLPISMATKTFIMLTSVVHHNLHKTDDDDGNVSMKIGQDVVSLLITLLPCYEMLNSEQAIEAAGRAEELVCCLVRMTPWDHHNDLVGSLCDVVQSIACELSVNQEHVTLLSLLESLVLLTKTYKKLLYRTHCIFWLSWMLLRCVNLPSYVSILLSQVECLIQLDTPKELLLPLVFPLTIASKAAGPSHQMINEFLLQVNKKNLSGAEAAPTGLAEVTMAPTSTSEVYSEICATAQLYCQLCCCSAQKDAWLGSLQQQLEQQELHISKDMHRLLLIMLSSIYLQQETAIQLSTLEVLKKFVKRSPTLCPEVLMFVQYLLSLQGSKELSLKLLYLLPALATHKAMVGYVVRVIHGLSEKLSLHPVIIRLLCKLWVERDEMFGHLHKLLLAPPPRHTSPEICREITLAKVATVHDICYSRPELHSEEMIGLVLQFLTEFSLQNPSMSVENDDGSTMAMSVESLHRLCLSEMIDFPVVWNMIAPKLKGEKRPKVLVATCNLFSLISTLDVDETLQPLYDTALTFLWNCAASSDGSVVEASFKTLSHFEPDNFKLNYLPNKLLSQLDCVDMATPGCQENPLVLTGQQCIQLAPAISPSGSIGYSTFLAHILANEMEQFLRGVAHLTQKHFPHLERFMRDSSQRLSKFISDNNGATSVNDFFFIGGLITAFQLTEPERSSRGYQQQLNHVVKNYKAMWNHCLTIDVSLSSSVCLHQLLSLPYSWETFMHRLYTVHVKSRLLEVCPPNMRDDKTSPVYQQKQWEAECCCDDHLCCALLCLCGMASTCLAITDTIGSVEGSIAWLRDWSSSSFLTSLLSTLADITGGMKCCKETGDDIFSFITKSFKSASDRSTVSTMATIAAVQVIKHVTTSFPLITLPTNMKDNMITIASNILSNLNVSNERSILLSYSLCEILLITHHQLPKMSSLLESVVQLCSVTSCNVLSVCVLGGLLPVLCEEGGGAHSVAQKLHKELVASLVMSRYNPATIQFQATCLAVARATPIMYNAGILTLADCKACVTVLQGLANKLHKFYVIHLSLGTLLCGLASGCVPNSYQILNEVTTQWMMTATQSQQTNMIIAGLYVMIGSVGCCDVLFSHTSVGTLLQHHLQANILTCSTALFTVLMHAKVQEEINHALWMIVQLRTATSKAITSELPKNYSYLSEERALPAMFDYLSNSGGCQAVVVSSLLSSLGHCSSLPPVDWTGVLLSIIKRMPSMCQPCLECALKLTRTSKGFHTFIVYCCSPVVLSGLQSPIQQLIMSKLYHLVPDMSGPSLSDLLGSLSHVCRQKKELLGSFVEGVQQALQLANLPDRTTVLLQHCIWNICHLLQQFPRLLDYAVCHMTIIKDIASCIFTTSGADAHTAAVALEDMMPNMTVLKSLIYSCMISLPSHTPHNFLHSCLAALPNSASLNHYVLIGLLNSIFNSIRSMNKQDLFHFLAHCVQESTQDSYVCKAEAQLMIKIALLGGCGDRSSIDLWLGFLGNSKPSTTDADLVNVHINQLVMVLLSYLATSKNSPNNLKQLLSQWIIEMVVKSPGSLEMSGNYLVLLTSGGSALWTVWINLV